MEWTERPLEELEEGRVSRSSVFFSVGSLLGGLEMLSVLSPFWSWSLVAGGGARAGGRWSYLAAGRGGATSQ